MNTPPLNTHDQSRSSNSDHVEHLKDTVTEAATDIQQSATEQIGRVETAIRRNPIASAGIAAGIGFLVAMLARR